MTMLSVKSGTNPSGSALFLKCTNSSVGSKLAAHKTRFNRNGEQREVSFSMMIRFTSSTKAAAASCTTGELTLRTFHCKHAHLFKKFSQTHIQKIVPANAFKVQRYRKDIEIYFVPVRIDFGVVTISTLRNGMK
jgi:hypothetical protein